MMEFMAMNRGYVRVTIEAFSDGEKTSHFEEYDSADWTRHPSSAASAIYGCVKGVFDHEDDVRRVFDELEKFTVSKEDE
jgi:hypothetical protein|tara:strand:- start:636 stop:872 length:237 start_codon:yes stop_codon:yes gene_type:complete